MTIDVAAAHDFMATHARVLDRRRFELQNGGTDAVRRARRTRRLPQPRRRLRLGPGGRPALPREPAGRRAHAFEVFEDIAPATALQAAALCDWLDSVSLPDGGLPLALPSSTSAGSAPWWREADPPSRRCRSRW